MRSEIGFIKLERTVMSGDLAENQHLFYIWVFLLVHANFKSSRAIVGGEPLLITRGQIWTSYREIAFKANVSLATVSKWVNYLVQTERISLRGFSKGSIITILNYEKYQGVPADSTRANIQSVSVDSTRGDTQSSTESERKVNARRTPSERKVNNKKKVIKKESNNEINTQEACVKIDIHKLVDLYNSTIGILEGVSKCKGIGAATINKIFIGDSKGNGPLNKHLPDLTAWQSYFDDVEASKKLYGNHEDRWEGYVLTLPKLCDYDMFLRVSDGEYKAQSSSVFTEEQYKEFLETTEKIGGF